MAQRKSSLAVKAKIDSPSLKRTLKKLDVVDDRIRKKAITKVQRTNAKIILAVARSYAPKEIGKDELSEERAGLYKRAMGSKVKVYRNGVVIVVVGARRGFKKQIGVRKRGKNKGQPVFYDPAKIAHLIERGTKRSRARPHLRPALDDTRSRVIDNTIRQVRDVIVASGGRL